MAKSISKIAYWFVLCSVLICMGAWAGWEGRKRVEPITIEIYAPMSVQQTQVKLRELGYDIEADNIWGPRTEKAFCNYMNKKVWPKGSQK